jgi:hypothetical protein
VEFIGNESAVYDKFNAGSEESFVVSVGPRCGIPKAGNIIDFFPALCFNAPMSTNNIYH